MRQRFRSSLAALAAVLLLLFLFAAVIDTGRPHEARAGTDTGRLDPSIRRLTWNIPFFLLPTFVAGTNAAGGVVTGSAISGTNAGTADGYLFASIVRDTTAHITRTTSLAQAPYPTRLKIGLISTSSVAGSKCNSVVVTYLDPNLLGHTETFASVGLTAQQTTTWAVEKLQRVAATGCSNNGATSAAANNNTILALQMTAKVWVPQRIHTAAGIVAACRMLKANLYGSVTPTRGLQIATGPVCAPQSQLTALAVDDRSNTVDLSSLAFSIIGGTAAPAWGDALYLSIRGATY